MLLSVLSVLSGAQGVVTTVARLGGLTGSVVGGFVLKYQGPTVLYRGAGCLVLLAGTLYVMSDKWCGSESELASGRDKGVYVEMKEDVAEVVAVNEDGRRIETKEGEALMQQ